MSRCIRGRFRLSLGSVGRCRECESRLRGKGRVSSQWVDQITNKRVRTNQAGFLGQYRIDDVGMRRYWRVSRHLGLVEKRVRRSVR